MTLAATGKRVEYYTDKSGEWRWTQYGGNGEVTAVAHEGFKTKRAARDNWLLGQRDAQQIYTSGREYIRDSDATTAVIHVDDLPDGKGQE